MRAASAIQTARLDLVPLRADDADEMVGVLADAALYAFTGGSPPDLANLRDRYDRLLRGWSANGMEQWFNWIVRLRSTGEAIGFVQATVRDAVSVAEIAWLIGTTWQRRGYAAEAASSLVGWLETVGVREIVAHVHPRHAASAGVATRAGLTPTGALDADGEQLWRRGRSDRSPKRS